jgi:hypothetical protein
VKTVPNIQAPSLTTTLSDTCMGSVSFGLAFTGFGATGGSTMVDQACVRRLDAREFRAMGLNDVALALLCQSDSNRKAVEATGHLCPGTDAPLNSAAARAKDPTRMTDNEKFRDPIVRQRLGLDALPGTEAPIARQSGVTGPVSERAPAESSRQGKAGRDSLAATPFLAPVSVTAIAGIPISAVGSPQQ